MFFSYKNNKMELVLHCLQTGILQKLFNYKFYIKSIINRKNIINVIFDDKYENPTCKYPV